MSASLPPEDGSRPAECWVLEEALVVEPQDQKARFNETGVPLCVFNGLQIVDAAIQFDDQLQLRAKEIDNLPSDGRLTSELQTLESAASKECP